MTEGLRGRVNLRHLRLLCEVGRLGTLNAAAERMSITQPSGSQAISRLEGHYGCRLLDRGRSGARPTRAGLIVLRRTDRLLAYITRMQSKIETNRRPRRGRNLASVVTFGQLKTLIAVSRFGGFSSAARHLAVSEPTVHRAARDFEALIGQRLFRSFDQGVNMTQLGSELARLAGLTLKELEMSFDDIDAHLGRQGGRIVIGSLPLARTDLVPTVLTQLCRSFPKATVKIAEGSYERLLDRLLRGEIDVIIGALRGRTADTDICELPLLQDSLSVIARRGHPLALRGETRRESLAEYPWVVSRVGTPTRNHFNQLFASNLPEGLIESSSLVILRGLLLKSDRLALLSRLQIEYEEKMGLLVSLPIPLPETSRPIGVTIRRDWHPTELQSLFLDLLERQGKSAR